MRDLAIEYFAQRSTELRSRLCRTVCWLMGGKQKAVVVAKKCMCVGFVREIQNFGKPTVRD
jgi:hypothetical protein